MGDPLVESFRFIDRSWAEIRESFRTGEPYSQIYERLFPQIVNVVYPGSIIDLPETRQAVQAQVERATPQGILSELGMGTRITTEIGKQVAIEDIQGNSFSLELKDQYKLFVFGAQEPKMETGDTLTRLYIALDPRKATDGFISLVRELQADGVLSHIQLCLNIEETEQLKISDNAIVMYITKSQQPDRQNILDSIVRAYKNAKARDPQLFQLEPIHRKSVLSGFFSSYRLFLDSNMSFVEMPDNRSFDGGGRQEIETAIGSNPSDSHLERIRKLKARTDQGVVWDGRTRKFFESIDTVPDGTEFYSIRRLHMPALVERGKYMLQRAGDSFSLVPVSLKI